MTTHQEDEVLERLNEQDGPRGFFLEVVTILEEAVDSLMPVSYTHLTLPTKA